MTGHEMDPESLHRITVFAAAAEEFCVWAENETRGAIQDARLARALVAELFRRAIDLPQSFDDADVPEESIAAEEYQRVFRRFGSLPFNYYSECFNPLVVPAEEAVTADLADDLADIWRDVKTGLVAFRCGEPASAGWQWRFHFESHWGHHASAALYALQSWFCQHTEELNRLPDQ